MLLDKYLMENLDLLGLNIMKKAGLASAPSNLKQLFIFFEKLKEEAETDGDAAANMIYQVLYNFVSSAEVRDRHTSPREFEDIFCSIFGTSSTDTTLRANPTPTTEIREYDKLRMGRIGTFLQICVVIKERKRMLLLVDMNFP